MVQITEELQKEVEKAKKRNTKERAATKKKATKKKPVQVVAKREDKIVAVRQLIRAKDVSLVESDFKMIKQLHVSVGEHLSAAFEKAAQIGKLLIHIKSLMERGEFTPWVARKMPFKMRTAQNYMLLGLYHAELIRQGITSITEAYAAISGVPAPDEEIDATNSDDTKGKSTIRVEDSVIDLENIKLPTKRAKGPMKDIIVNQDTIDCITEEKYPYENCKGAFLKLVVRLPIPGGNEKLVGDFVTVAQTLLKPGGKLIFHRKANK